MLETESEDLLR